MRVLSTPDLAQWQAELAADIACAGLSPLGWPSGTIQRPIRAVLADWGALYALDAENRRENGIDFQENGAQRVVSLNDDELFHVKH
jgi:hypothetical protein